MARTYIVEKRNGIWCAHYDTDDEEGLTECSLVGKTPVEALKSLEQFEDYYRRK